MLLSTAQGRGAVLFALTYLVGGCDMKAGDTNTEMSNKADQPDTSIIQLLEAGQPIFGIFSGEHTAEGGRAMAETRNTDFVFYSLESGPFDIPAMEEYASAMAEASDDQGTHPMLLRIPPIRDGHDQARARVTEGLRAGVAGIVYPHVENAEDAALAVSALGDQAWPANPKGHLVNLLLLEDQVAIDNVREIVSTAGVSMVSPGPGDLRRVYDGDMERVENAIQTVLAACLELDVPCGVTAGAEDIADRLEQGFRIIIVTEPEALAAGMAAAHR